MAWLFAIIGFAHRHLTKRPAFLGAATEAVYPFYMLHQTVTVIAVYWLLSFGVTPVAGFVARRVGHVPRHLGDLCRAGATVRWFVRPLFGMKAAPRTVAVTMA